MPDLSTSDPRSVISSIIALGGTARTSELLAAGVHPRTLYAARDSGVLIELSRGVYRLAALTMTEPDLVVVASRMPRVVFGLVTAMHLLGLTTEIPRAVHVMLPRGTRPARLTWPPLEVYHVPAETLTVGVEDRVVDGVDIHLTDSARTVADAFKFRRRIGLDVAVEALRAALAQRTATPAEIDRMARGCRVQQVIRPYLEALAG